MCPSAFDEYGKHIEGAISALRRQLAMGKVEYMRESAHLFIVGRGYAPELSEKDWRRLAYIMTQANLQAYESMAARHQGNVVPQPKDAVLPSQFEVQNAAKALSIPPDQCAITWTSLYEVWKAECNRPANTHSAYLAATKMFMSYCASPPQSVTREDVLGYRDFLIQDSKLASGTVSNKIGFLGTIINSGRDNTKFAKHLPFNPFQNIKIEKFEAWQGWRSAIAIHR